jgi:hypothetical protein
MDADEGERDHAHATQDAGTYGGYTPAAPRIFINHGEPQVWFTDQDRGFFVVRFTNGAWPSTGAGG